MSGLVTDFIDIYSVLVSLKCRPTYLAANSRYRRRLCALNKKPLIRAMSSAKSVSVKYSAGYQVLLQGCISKPESLTLFTEYRSI